jgi:hypothetical protein
VVDAGSPVELSTTEVVTSIDNISPVTSILPTPPIDIPVIINPDIATKVIEYSVYAADYASRAEQIADMVSLAFM